MNGQLLPKEREFLHQAVLDSKPSLVFEVGTWKGGGSTWQIAKALEKNGHGHLYTCETDNEFYLESKELYSENNFVVVSNNSSKDLIQVIIFNQKIPDFLFFDGPEDRETAYNDFIALDPFLKPGSMFSMHDWDSPSIKAETIRPYIENLKTWKLVNKLTSPESVGICLYQKL